MIISFYDKDFRGLQDNASLVIDNNSYSLIRRGVELDELRCTCEPFTENIQPTFLVVKNDKGNYVYGCLAGIPQLTNENKTIVVGTDLKSMFKSDVLLNFSSHTTVNSLFNYVFTQWKEQVNQNSFICELAYEPSVGTKYLTNLKHDHKNSYNVWDDIFVPYLKYYGLYMTSHLDLVNKKVVFTIGRAMRDNLNIKLWEHGLYDYGKWIADVNETQGYVHDTSLNAFVGAEYKWILRSDNVITANHSNRDIYPIKRKIIVKETRDTTKVPELLREANTEALELLCESLYNEDIMLSGINAGFETNFHIYVHRGDAAPYKSLPCGELHYDASGLTKVQIGYRFTGLQFLL